MLPGPLAVDEDTESFFEGEIVEGGLLKLIFKSLGHPEEFHGIEFIEGLFVKHRFDSFHYFGFLTIKNHSSSSLWQCGKTSGFFPVSQGREPCWLSTEAVGKGCLRDTAHGF